MEPPRTRYARSGDVNIAYQVVGEGPIDLVFVMGWVSNVEYSWREPHYADFLRRLASFSRLILFDKRGTGLSDRVSNTELPTLEQRMDDVRAVMDAAGSKEAALIGISEGGPMCALFAATYPERTRALVMIGSYACARWSPDYPWARTPEQQEAWIRSLSRGWGVEPVGFEQRMPSLAGDARTREWWTEWQRMSASPGAVLALNRMNRQIDIRQVLPAISRPTLIIHAAGDLAMPFGHGEYLSRSIPGARMTRLESTDHLPWARDSDAVIDEISEFVTGVRQVEEHDRVLATVLFVDIVNSTQQLAERGDRAWRELLNQFYAILRRNLEAFRGREIDTTGDGLFAAFDGPARAVRCACAATQSVTPLGVAIRAGLHTGECEVLGPKLGGIAVHLGARVCGMAGPNEVLVSSTVKDLVAGSGLRFEDRGAHRLKGVSEEWHLFAASA